MDANDVPRYYRVRITHGEGHYYANTVVQLYEREVAGFVVNVKREMQKEVPGFDGHVEVFAA